MNPHEVPDATATARSSTTLRTPHLVHLIAALEARQLTFHVIAPDTLRVDDIAPDDLGWLIAQNGIVVYAMTTAASADAAEPPSP
jgi:hypothetical protein